MLEDDFSFPIQMCSSAPTKQFLPLPIKTQLRLFETFQRILFPKKIYLGKDYSLAGGDVIWATVQKSDPLTLLPGWIFQYFIQHCFICCPSDSTVPRDAGIDNGLYPKILCCFSCKLIPLTIAN